MKLIVGLGNIGAKYDRTRHNTGFMALDNFSFTHQFKPFEQKSKLDAEIIETELEGERILLAKPTTFMNRSGQSLINIKRYYSVNSETTLIVQDDIDIDFGTIRVRKGGGSGGHNGIRSLPQVVQSNSFRIRIGVSNQKRQAHEAADFVLDQFLPEEKDKLPNIFSETDQLIESFIRDSLSETSIKI